MIVGPKKLKELIRRYNGFGADLTSDETQILLFALYCESEERDGIAAAAMKSLVITRNKPRFCHLKEI